MTVKFKAYLQQGDWGLGQKLAIRTEHGYVQPMTVKTTSRGEAIEAFLSETQEDQEDGLDSVTQFMQAIMDAGWKAGLKPAGYEDASRELTATKFHLEDMRLLAKVRK